MGVGQCQRNGVTVCGADEPVDDGDGAVQARPAPAQDERCNDLDDDCDNQFDEDIGKVTPAWVRAFASATVSISVPSMVRWCAVRRPDRRGSGR